MKDNIFIAVSGGTGSGKTTVVRSLLKKFPRDHDQIFAGSRPAALLLALILLPLSYVLGAFAATVIPSVPASADGNWDSHSSRMENRLSLTPRQMN